MPEKKTMQRAKKAARRGKAPSAQAGEFVGEEMRHVREGKHGARSPKQAIAIGLAKARRSGVKLPAGKRASAPTRKRAARDEAVGQGRAKPSRRITARRRRASGAALAREPRGAATKQALSRQAKQAAAMRPRSERVQAAKKAARTRKRTAKKK